nr:PhnA-like protein [Acuticoccus sediminis]
MIHSVSWGAIFAGVVVALVVQILLSMLGAGIGFATIGAAAAPGPSTFSISGGIWVVVSAIIATFVGGYIAARLSGRTTATTGALHGLTAWAFSTLVVLYLLTSSVGSIVGGAFSGIATFAGGVGQTVVETAQPAVSAIDPMATIERQVRATGGDPEALEQSAVNALRALVSGAGNTEATRAEAAEALANARGIPVAEASRQVDEIEAAYQRTVDRTAEAAARAADATADVVSTGALLAFAGLVLGAIAGWLGGRSGVVHPVLADRLAPARHRRG